MSKIGFISIDSKRPELKHLFDFQFSRFQINVHNAFEVIRMISKDEQKKVMRRIQNDLL